MSPIPPTPPTPASPAPPRSSVPPSLQVVIIVMIYLIGSAIHVLIVVAAIALVPVTLVVAAAVSVGSALRTWLERPVGGAARPRACARPTPVPGAPPRP